MLLAPLSILRLTSIINRIAERVPAQLRENIQFDYVIQGLPVRLSIGDRTILMELLRNGQDLDLNRGNLVTMGAFFFRSKYFQCGECVAFALRVTR